MLQLIRNIESGHLRHHKIKNDQIRFFLFRQCETILAVMRFDDGASL